MKTLKAVFKEIIGMFVDDGSLAIVVLAIVAVASWIAFEFERGSLEAGVVLFVGCLAGLAENVIRTAKRSGRRRG